MGKTVAGTDLPTVGDLKTKQGRGQLGRVASATFVGATVGTPVVLGGIALGVWLYQRGKSAAGGMTEAFRGLA